MENQLRNKIDREEFDYLALLSALSQYKNPRAKITSLLRKGVIVRVKKGLYVFGEDYRKRPYSRELLANLIYGPSFVSLDYALFTHGLIPERVATVTSVTNKRAKRFETPVGEFVYRRAPSVGFHLGIKRIEQVSSAYLLAEPERALIDKIRDHRAGPIRSQKEMAKYLFEDLRIDEAIFSEFNGALFEKIVQATGYGKGVLAVKLLNTLKRRKS